jgi:hypothetical protein
MRGLLHILVQLATIDAAFSTTLIYSELSKNYFNQRFRTQRIAEKEKQYSNPYITNNYAYRPRNSLSPNHSKKNEYFKKEIN